MNARSGLALFAFVAMLPALAAAQRPDTARAVPTPAHVTPRDSIIPPITPGRAFLYSAFVPGYSQSVLGRHKAASAFVLAEAISVVMIRESAADVREAKRFEGDTLVLSYGANGSINTQPGLFGRAEVKSRRSHVEDWIALLIANHLLAGADAFVAAHLWDVPAKIGVSSSANGTVVTASLKLP
jgi:hypothetical protein